MNELMTSCNSENVQLITAIWVFVFRRLNETYNETYNGTTGFCTVPGAVLSRYH